MAKQESKKPKSLSATDIVVIDALKNAQSCLTLKKNFDNKSLANFKKKELITQSTLITNLMSNGEDAVEWLNTIIFYAADKLKENEHAMTLAEDVMERARKQNIPINPNVIAKVQKRNK